MDIWENDDSDEMDIDNDLMDDCEEDSFSESEQESNVKQLQKLNLGDDFHVVCIWWFIFFEIIYDQIKNDSLCLKRIHFLESS